MTRKKRLGRGLEALLNSTGESGGVEPTPTPAPVTPSPVAVAVAPDAGSPPPGEDNEGTSDVVHLNVYEIEDNPFQPRRIFSEPEIVSLAESLKEHDILQPILVRLVDGRYQLISGERRLRAAIKANWQTIPARVREADDRLVSELAIVENLQRKDLNAIEKALSFRRYLNEHGSTQEALASRLKIDRSTVANLMRLLELPMTVQDALQSGKITAGHARALLPLGEEHEQIEFCEQILREGLSVRAVERAVAERIAADDSIGNNAAARKKRTRDHQIASLEQNLKTALGTKVQIKTGSRQRGQIVLHYANHAEFERIQAILMGQAADTRVA